jgi:hypothetical protein
MRIPPLLAFALVGGAFVLVRALWEENKPTGELRARPRTPLSSWEQEMHRRLCEAFPDMIVLAQVALTALVTLPRKDRDRVGHKVVDFVLLGADYEVRAAIDLDEGSEAARHALGEPVRELLELAGYRVLELDRIPEVPELRALLAPALAAPAATRPSGDGPGAPATRTGAGARPGRPPTPAPDFPTTRIE